MIRQTDNFFKLHAGGDKKYATAKMNIYPYGCNFLCNLMIVNPECTHEDACEIYALCVANGAITANTTVKFPDRICKTAADYFGVATARQIGWKDKDGIKGAVPPSPQVKHTVHRHKTATGQHFTATLDIRGDKVEYDPHQLRLGVYAIDIKKLDIQQSYYTGGCFSG